MTIYTQYDVTAKNGRVTMVGSNKAENHHTDLDLLPTSDLALARREHPEFPAGAWLRAEKLLDEINKINLTGGYGR